MEPDFSGWATKAGLVCKDGRTIMPDAFKHQDKIEVPLVWQHGHTDPENILGHAVLENRAEGVYAYGFFNSSKKAQHAKIAVNHKDIKHMSIWANELIERSRRVFHGAIKEVSLVISGANPGALIENLTVAHGDGDFTELEDEAYIFTGLDLDLEHTDLDKEDDPKIEHATKDGDTSMQDVYDTLNNEQKKLVSFMIGEALLSNGGTAVQSDLKIDDPDLQVIYDTLNDDQQNLFHGMLDEALSRGKKNEPEKKEDPEKKDEKASVEHSDVDKKGDEMSELKHNIFENKDGKETPRERVFISHDDMKSIIEDAESIGSLKRAVQRYAKDHLEHGINDIETLFPDAQSLSNTPDFISRRMEWVAKLLGGIRKAPFAKVRTTLADITVQEARAKGYIKGNLKKEEFFSVARRETTPTTVYKKQAMDRDDVVDITDFDVVAWLKGEMRVMLDEECARAILLGDGRAVDDEDKINESNIRPVAKDHEVYTTTITVPLDETDVSLKNVIREIALHRSEIRGTGTPTFWTTERFISRGLLLEDNTGRKLYDDVSALATAMRVADLVPVEVMEEDAYADIVGVLFNPIDYVAGANRGGQVSMFDDFDIDYNKQKYLIETRFSGALVKYRAAMVVMSVPAGTTEVVPAAPTFDPVTNQVTITDTLHVVYRNQDTDAVLTAAGGPYAVAPDTTLNIHAEPASSAYYIEDSNDADWAFTNNG